MDREVTEEDIDEAATRLIPRLDRMAELWKDLSPESLSVPIPQPKPAEAKPEPDHDYEELKSRWDRKRIADELANRLDE